MGVPLHCLDSDHGRQKVEKALTICGAGKVPDRGFPAKRPFTAV
jgi:hypothetical protein